MSVVVYCAIMGLSVINHNELTYLSTVTTDVLYTDTWMVALQDGDHQHQKKRFLVQNTIKRNCHARIYIRQICYSPTVKPKIQVLFTCLVSCGDIVIVHYEWLFHVILS